MEQAGRVPTVKSVCEWERIDIRRVGWTEKSALSLSNDGSKLQIKKTGLEYKAVRWMNGFKQGTNLHIGVVADTALKIRQSLEAEFADLVVDEVLMNPEEVAPELRMF